jgi:hypothetical protein
MNATHTPFVYSGLTPRRTIRRGLVPAAAIARKGATKASLILAGCAAMGYLMALSFFRLG